LRSEIARLRPAVAALEGGLAAVRAAHGWPPVRFLGRDHACAFAALLALAEAIDNEALGAALFGLAWDLTPLPDPGRLFAEADLELLLLGRCPLILQGDGEPVLLLRGGGCTRGPVVRGKSFRLLAALVRDFPRLWRAHELRSHPDLEGIANPIDTLRQLVKLQGLRDSVRRPGGRWAGDDLYGLKYPDLVSPPP
jgi:hypothetical protein